MATDLERVRGIIAWWPSVSDPDPARSHATRLWRRWFDLGTVASPVFLAITPPHAATLVAFELFVVGRLLLISWAPAGDAPQTDVGVVSVFNCAQQVPAYEEPRLDRS